MDWNNKVSDNVRNVPFSGIRKFFDLASTMKDVISLGVGEPDYSAPDKVIDACIESLKCKETSYTSNWGLIELRTEIAKLFKKRLHQRRKRFSSDIRTILQEPSWREKNCWGLQTLPKSMI